MGGGVNKGDKGGGLGGKEPTRGNKGGNKGRIRGGKRRERG